jgi:transcriptional regulator with XRE-family HTH domain
MRAMHATPTDDGEVEVINSFKKLRQEIGVSRPIFSRLMAISERSLADYETNKKEPSDTVLRKMRELERLVVALQKTIDPVFLRKWLMEPNSAFDKLKPIEVIERGESDRIWQMIYFIRSGDPT